MEEIKDLVKTYTQAEQDLLNALDKITIREECKGCYDREVIRTIHEGEFPEIVTRCLKCGGVVV